MRDESPSEEMVREMGKNFARRWRTAERAREREIAQRHAAAMAQIERLVHAFQVEDPQLRSVILFGSLAHGTPHNPRFDIDLAVDSDKYWELLGIALDQPIPVDLVDLPRTSPHLRTRILAEGRALYDVG
ncbi:MAG: nucleotidyltransferase domain-containing protein [Alkalispirochaeta sp.]